VLLGLGLFWRLATLRCPGANPRLIVWQEELKAKDSDVGERGDLT